MSTTPVSKVDPKLPSMQPRHLTGNCQAKVIASSCKLGAAALRLNLDLPCHEYMKALLAHKLEQMPSSSSQRGFHRASHSGLAAWEYGRWTGFRRLPASRAREAWW